MRLKSRRLFADFRGIPIPRADTPHRIQRTGPGDDTGLAGRGETPAAVSRAWACYLFVFQGIDRVGHGGFGDMESGYGQSQRDRQDPAEKISLEADTGAEGVLL